jgi:2-polyprenyl-3-methyl-5-hydroxy-6-metoxy-1,4-benzoquinol methylase
MSSYKDYGYSTDQAGHVHAYLLPQLKKLLSKTGNKRILDIGCGNGYVAMELIKLGFDVYGTDASVQGIEIARRKHPDRFFIQDLSKDGLPDELSQLSFDTIISTEVIEHLYDPRGYVQFCKKVLLKNGGGELIISTPYHGYIKNIALSISGSLDKHFTALWDGGHIKFWSNKTLSALLQEQGFHVITFVGCGRVPYLWKSMMIRSKI